MERAKRFLKKFISIIKKPEMRILPGQLAFFLVMSLIPLAALLGAIAARFSIPVSTVEQGMNGIIPKGVINVLIEIMNSKAPDLNILIFFISAFILASNGTHSMIITSNEIYKLNSDTIIFRRIKAILMTFILVGILLFLFLIPISGDIIFKIITTSIKNIKLANAITMTYQILKYPLLIVILYFNIKILYVVAPDEEIKSMTTTKGAIFTTVGWILATEVYSFYIGTFANYDVFYGSISNILILLLWIYILSYIFVIGMIINAGSYKANLENEKVVKEIA